MRIGWFMLLVMLVIIVAAANARTSAQVTQSVYFPVVSIFARPSLFAFESGGGLTDPRVYARAAELGARWVRLNGVVWHEIQLQRDGPYNWQALAHLDTLLVTARELGLSPVVVIRGTPLWAAVVPSNCAAIRDEHLGTFAAFLEALAQRYRDQVMYWELGNEPDVDPALVPIDSPFGCMGDVNDPYYGGERYGRMLQVAAPALQRGNPRARIVFGGVLLNSPIPDHPTFGRSDRFVEGALLAGAGPYFDVLAYHSYPSYSGQQLVDHDTAVPGNWQDLGGWTIGKANFLRQALDRFGVQKPLWLNETSLLCYEDQPYCNPPEAGFFKSQAEHLVRSFARAAAAGTEQVTWYTLEGPGWRSSSLLDGGQAPRPAYYAFQQMARMVEPFRDVQPVDYGAGIEAYRFVKGQTVVDVLWSQQGDRRSVTVPMNRYIDAKRFDGNRVPSQTASGIVQLQVDFAPVLIERRP